VIRVVVDDIAFVQADAIVRPATATLESTTPSLRRLEQVGGQRFWDGLQVREELAVGAAVVTSGGDLAAEFVIHTIIRSTTEPVSGHSVRRALRSAYQRAADWALARVAMPLAGLGAGNLPLEEAVTALWDVVREHAGAVYPTDLTIVVDTEEEKQVVESFAPEGML